MSQPKSAVYSSLCLLAICIVLMISACSKSSNDSGTPASNTGGVSFQLVWQQPSTGAKAAIRTPSFNACNDFALITISATVSSGTTTVSSGSWPCSLHEGLIVGIPAGTNYTVQVNGISSGPTPTTWSGQASAITVITGQITDAGTIIMGYIGGDTTKPTVLSIAPHSNPALTTNIPVTDRIDIAFSEPMAISTIAATNITLNNGTAVPGTVTYSGASNTAAFIPSAALLYNNQYVLQVASCVTSSCIKDTAGNSLTSDYTFTFTAESAPATTSNAPSGVTAAAGNRQVMLDWLAVTGATSYSVYYGTSPGVTTTATPLSVDARPPFVHMNLTNGQTYYYIVTAVNNNGESLPSTEVSATPSFPGGSPPPPAILSVAPGIGQNTITWSAVLGATYNLYWSNGPIIPDKTAADNVIRGVASPYIHSTIAPTSCYIVTAVSAIGESADSMQFCSGSGGMSFVW